MKNPKFTTGQKVTVLCNVHWTDDNDAERITIGPVNGVVHGVDVRSDVTIYEIILDHGAGYFMHEIGADGDVVIPLVNA